MRVIVIDGFGFKIIKERSDRTFIIEYTFNNVEKLTEKFNAFENIRLLSLLDVFPISIIKYINNDLFIKNEFHGITDLKIDNEKEEIKIKMVGCVKIS